MAEAVPNPTPNSEAAEYKESLQQSLADLGNENLELQLFLDNIIDKQSEGMAREVREFKDSIKMNALKKVPEKLKAIVGSYEEELVAFKERMVESRAALVRNVSAKLGKALNDIGGADMAIINAARDAEISQEKMNSDKPIFDQLSNLTTEDFEKIAAALKPAEAANEGIEQILDEAENADSNTGRKGTRIGGGMGSSHITQEEIDKNS